MDARRQRAFLNPRGGRRAALRLAAFALIGVWGAGGAWAQVTSTGVIATASGASALFRVSGVRDGGGTVDAWARVGSDAAFGVVWRYAHVFGPLGNVIVEGGTDLLLPSVATGADPGFRWAIGARGVFGPVAASLRLDAGTVGEDELDATLRPDAPRRVLGVRPGAWDAGARASVTYRIDRESAIAFDPRIRVVDGDVVAFAIATLRRAGLRDDLDLWLGVEGGVLAEAGAAAVGAGVIWTRRREPDSSLRLWIGGDGERVLPGIEGLVSARSPGASWALAVGWVPHRLDTSTWRVTFDAATDAPPPVGATWRVRATVVGTPSGHAARSSTRDSPTFSVSLALERARAAPPGARVDFDGP